MSNPYAPPEDRRRPADDDAAPPHGSAPTGQPPQQPPPHWYPPQLPPGQHHPGQQLQPGQQHQPGLHRTKPEPPPTDPAGAERARRFARTFGLLLLAGVLLGTLRVPWQVVALPFVVAALVYGVRGLVTASRAHVRGALVPMLASGVAIAAFWAFASAAMLVLWPQQLKHEQCLANAITVTATAECDRAYQKSINDLLPSRSSKG